MSFVGVRTKPSGEIILYPRPPPVPDDGGQPRHKEATFKPPPVGTIAPGNVQQIVFDPARLEGIPMADSDDDDDDGDNENFSLQIRDPQKEDASRGRWNEVQNSRVYLPNNKASTDNLTKFEESVREQPNAPLTRKFSTSSIHSSLESLPTLGEDDPKRSSLPNLFSCGEDFQADERNLLQQMMAEAATENGSLQHDDTSENDDVKFENGPDSSEEEDDLTALPMRNDEDDFPSATAVPGEDEDEVNIQTVFSKFKKFATKFQKGKKEKKKRKRQQSEDSLDGNFEIPGIYPQSKRHAFLLLQAPVDKRKLDIKSDEEARSQQFEEFCELYPDLTIKDTMKCSVKSYDDIMNHSDRFFKKMSIYAKIAVIVFNGHGSAKGLELSDENNNVNLNRFIDDMKALRSEQREQGQKLPYLLRIVFAQCHGHHYEEPEDNDIQIMSFTNDKQTKTVSIVRRDLDGVRRSKHIHLSRHASRESIHDDVMQELRTVQQ